MASLPAFINDKINMPPARARIHSGIRRDRFQSGRIAQIRQQTGDYITQRITAMVQGEANLRAWERFKHDIQGAGFFNYRPPDQPSRIVRARFVRGAATLTPLDGALEWHQFRAEVEYQNAPRLWQPTPDYADDIKTIHGVWGDGCYITGYPAVNQLVDGADDIAAADDGIIQKNTGAIVDPTDGGDSLPHFTLNPFPAPAAAGNTLVLLLRHDIPSTAVHRFYLTLYADYADYLNGAGNLSEVFITNSGTNYQLNFRYGTETQIVHGTVPQSNGTPSTIAIRVKNISATASDVAVFAGYGDAATAAVKIVEVENHTSVWHNFYNGDADAKFVLGRATQEVSYQAEFRHLVAVEFTSAPSDDDIKAMLDAYDSAEPNTLYGLIKYDD